MPDYMDNELKHHGVKGMKWGVRKADYRAMSRSQKKQTRKQYAQDKMDRKAEKRVGKHGVKAANAISIGKGVLSTTLRGTGGAVGMLAASKMVATSNALGVMAAIGYNTVGAATLVGVGAIPMASLGVYGLYSAGKRLYRTGKEVSANERVNRK